MALPDPSIDTHCAVLEAQLKLHAFLPVLIACRSLLCRAVLVLRALTAVFDLQGTERRSARLSTGGQRAAGWSLDALLSETMEEHGPGALCFAASGKLNSRAPSAAPRAGERQHPSTAFPRELALLALRPNTGTTAAPVQHGAAAGGAAGAGMLLGFAEVPKPIRDERLFI